MSRNASDRRAHILRALQDTDAPLSASALAAQLGVSRQIIVGDVALLRAAGEQIDATPRGYRLQRSPAGFCALVACRHTGVEALAAELYAVVENGGVLEDVAVDNPLYGQLTARLDIATRRDAEQFLARAAESGAVSWNTVVSVSYSPFVFSMSEPRQTIRPSKKWKDFRARCEPLYLSCSWSFMPNAPLRPSCEMPPAKASSERSISSLPE